MTTEFSIDRFRSTEADVFAAEGTLPWSFDEEAWGRWIADAFRILAAPSLPQRFPSAPVGGDEVFTAAAYWNPLVHLLLYRLGWTRPSLGLEWWYRTGKPMDDPTLALVDAIWGADGYLDWFGAWLATLDDDAFPLLASRAATSQAATNPVDREWIAQQRERAEGSGIPNPLSGGSDALHLREHCHEPLVAVTGAGAQLLRSSQSNRRAVLTLDTAAGWYRTLMDLGGRLPDITPRSWHVDVYVRPVGWLGTFRRSRTTGLWFSGRHRVHQAGNV